jgi:ankyrin repeat domain-containing protein 50
MDGLSAASSVIAVIQISSQIFDLCRTYYLNIKDARKDIERLRNEITALQDVLVNVADLANDPNPFSLKTLSLISREDGPLQQCQLELMALAARLEPGEGTNKMKAFGLRALKWPFTSKEVDKILIYIGRHKSTLNLALTTDQT